MLLEDTSLTAVLTTKVAAASVFESTGTTVVANTEVFDRVAVASAAAEVDKKVATIPASIQKSAPKMASPVFVSAPKMASRVFESAPEMASSVF